MFEILIIPHTLNINNWRTTSAKSINHNVIRKLIEYSLKHLLVRAMFASNVLHILLLKVGRYYDPHSGLQGAKGLMLFIIIAYNFSITGLLAIASVFHICLSSLLSYSFTKSMPGKFEGSSKRKFGGSEKKLLFFEDIKMAALTCSEIQARKVGSLFSKQCCQNMFV